MARMLICYYSRTKHTQHMAEAVAEGAQQVAGMEVEIKDIKEIDPRSLVDYDAIIMGSPTYYGTMSAECKRLLDDSVAVHGRLEGKVGGAFSSSGNIGGGSETTILDLLKAMLIHGMVVLGSPQGDHYGPTAVGDADQRSLDSCRRMGKKWAELSIRLHVES